MDDARVLDAIRAKVTDWSSSDLAIAGSLNNELVANPTPQATVPAPFSVSGLLGSLGATAQANLAGFPSLPRLLDDVNKNDVAASNLWATLLHGTGKISDAEYATLLGMINATRPDPAWPAQVAWSLANLGRYLSSDDVAAARRGI